MAIMSVRAKFKVTRTSKSEYGEEVELSAVTTGSDENKSFFKFTPNGQIRMSVLNAEASSQFEVGKEFYVDFTRAE